MKDRAWVFISMICRFHMVSEYRLSFRTFVVQVKSIVLFISRPAFVSILLTGIY